MSGKLIGFASNPVPFAVLVSLSVVACLATTSWAEEHPEPKSLFDGKTLNGWDGDPKLWSVQDGVIHGQTTADNPLKQNSFLIWTGGVVRDFHLKMQFRVFDEGRGNSGIQYRSHRNPDVGKWSVGGYQADIDREKRYSGILYEERGRGILAERGEKVVIESTDDGKFKRDVTGSVGDRDALAEFIHVGEWNSYEVNAEGNHYIHKINGHVMVDVTDNDAAHRADEGILALQLHVGDPMRIQFKDILLTQLSPSEPAKNASAQGGESARFTASEATAAVRISVPEGFKVERLYSVPFDQQGSWVSLTLDNLGRLIASDQYGKLYRVTPPPVGTDDKTKVEPIDLDIGSAQGLLYAFNSLYVMVNGGKSGLHRLRDTNGDDRFDEHEFLLPLDGGGEHGPHAVLLGPDGKSLYICAGNHTNLPPIDTSRVPQNWSEDHLLPRMWDARGHATGRMAPGGWIAKVNPDGGDLEIVSTGYRNEYDIAFTPEGELFTYDADMEWDIGTPWYRPTRINHATSGSEFGWRAGTGKWPAHYPDSLPAVVDIGPGSPTGIVFGTGTRFPAKYQRALFASDWSYGVLYAVHLRPEGASYTATAERFAFGTPLPLTDLVVNPKDGALYFTIGGRKVQSGLYRVTYVGDEATGAVAFDDGNSTGAAELRTLRRKLETLHERNLESAVDEAWPFLNHEDRHVRYAARIAIELQPVGQWSQRALDEKKPIASIHAMIALARCGKPPVQPMIIESLGRIDWLSLNDDQRLDLLRAYSLAFARMGPGAEDLQQKVIAKLDKHYPYANPLINRELAALLIYANAPHVAERTVALLEKAPTQEEQIHYAFCLRVLSTGWTSELRQRYFDWFTRQVEQRGGMSFDGFVRNIRQEAITHLPEAERERVEKELADAIERAKQQKTESRPIVKKWTVEELLSQSDGTSATRDFTRGREMFAAAQCFKCHRVRGEGGITGPDLTGVSGRFSIKDLLTSIVDPSKEVSDQFQTINFELNNGKIVSGRVINMFDAHIAVNTDLLDPTAITNIERSSIVSTSPSPTSPMPTGLLDTLHRDEVLDLMAFLRSGGDPHATVFTAEKGSSSLTK
ncbi:MAG: family 16 glycoside hydrolase [Pirellulaceae bacterium]